MKSIVVERSAVNLAALDADVRAALGSVTSGVSVAGNRVIIHLQDNATPQQESQAMQIAQSHDPSKLTPEQQAAITRKSKLDQARRDYGATELDLQPFGGQPALIQQIAQKVVFLEREIAEMRGGR